MAEIFSGNITAFKLIDILRLLTSGGKTGVLHVERAAEGGEIYLEDGVIVHVTSKNEIGEEALFTLLTWMEGAFHFRPDAVTAERSVETETSLLLDAAIMRLDEWDQIKEIVPSPDMVFKLSSNRAPDEITIKHDDWLLLSEIDGKRTVGQIAGTLGLRDYDAARMIYKMFVVGLIEVAAEPKLRPKKTVDPNFLDFLREKLTQVIGPVASFVLDEEIKAVGEEMRSFPLEKTPMLVEKVSREIDDDAKRLEFQKMVLAALRSI